MQKIVGLVGLRGSGKDTAAQFLVEKGWKRIAFADALYAEVAKAFGVTVEFLQRRETKELPQKELALVNCQDQFFVAVMLHDAGIRLGVTDGRKVRPFMHKARSPRQILQKWGTEYRRGHFTDDYWRLKVEGYIRAHPEANFVVTDVRFPDEGRLIEIDLGGELGRITRPGLAGANDESLLHSSEVAMLNYPIAANLENLEGPAGIAKFKEHVLATFH